MEPNNVRKTPAGEQNELFKKQVFSDETLRTADPDEEETGEQHFETLTFDKPAVLDERFAARKAERETAQPPQAKPAAPRPAAKCPPHRKTNPFLMSADCTAAKHRPTQHCASRGRLRRLCCACCLCAAASGQRAPCGTFGPTAILKTCRKARITVLPQTVHNFA